MSHRTVREPTEEEHTELKRMKQEEIGRVAVRAHLVLLSSRGYSAPEIAELHQVAHPMVYKWIERFDEEGPAGLYDREREGRPPKIDEQAEQELRRVLEAAPTEEGYDFTRWTAPRLAEHLKEKLGIDVHPETVRDALTSRMGYSWKRPRRSLAPPSETEFAERIRRIDCAIANASPQTTVLFEDETEFKRFPPLRRAWMRTGEQCSVEVPDQNDKFALYGAFDALTGETVVESHPKVRSDHTNSFLRSLLGQIEGQILLVWDNASWHTSKKVDRLLKKHDRLQVLALPARSPQANPIEDLWRELKNRVASNLNRSLDVLKACRRFFDQLSNEQALARPASPPINLLVCPYLGLITTRTRSI